MVGLAWVVLATASALAVGDPALAQESAPTSRTCTLEAGVRELSLQVGDVERRYLVSVGPGAARASSPPVLFLWHGFGSNGRWMLDALDPARDWPEGIAVAPQGLPRRIRELGSERRAGWQLSAGELGDRDLRFFDALLSALSEQYCVDRTRVYSAGMSNGAYFSNLLGCQRGRDLAAIAPVAGGGPYPASCSVPVAVHILHGRRDDIVSIRTARESLAAWARVNGCEPPQDLPEQECVSLAGCSAPISFCSHRGGHIWPGGASASIVRFVRALGR